MSCPIRSFWAIQTWPRNSDCDPDVCPGRGARQPLGRYGNLEKMSLRTFLAYFSAPCHPHAPCDMLDSVLMLCWMLIGGCNSMLCSIHVDRLLRQDHLLEHQKLLGRGQHLRVRQGGGRETGDGETGRRGDGETARQTCTLGHVPAALLVPWHDAFEVGGIVRGDGATGRRGDGETGRGPVTQRITNHQPSTINLYPPLSLSRLYPSSLSFSVVSVVLVPSFSLLCSTQHQPPVGIAIHQPPVGIAICTPFLFYFLALSPLL